MRGGVGGAGAPAVLASRRSHSSGAGWGRGGGGRPVWPEGGVHTPGVRRGHFPLQLPGSRILPVLTCRVARETGGIPIRSLQQQQSQQQKRRRRRLGAPHSCASRGGKAAPHRCVARCPLFTRARPLLSARGTVQGRGGGGASGRRASEGRCSPGEMFLTRPLCTWTPPPLLTNPLGS